MAGRFPLYTDADIHGPVVEGLRRRGWDIMRAVDRFPERTADPVHFAEAAHLGRVLVSNDSDMRAIAEQWLQESRAFAGLVWWPRKHYARMSTSDILEAFEELARRDSPTVETFVERTRHEEMNPDLPQMDPVVYRSGRGCRKAWVQKRHLPAVTAACGGPPTSGPEFRVLKASRGPDAWAYVSW